MPAQRGEPDPVRRSLEKALAGHYSILRLLGRGGMGAVYLARDEALERLVALKVLLPDTSEDAARRARFRREARTAARLAHPNIVPLHGFGEVDGMLYLVMGYVQGEPLSAWMRSGTPVAVEKARRIGAEIADALDHAHSRGIVHRDVKPENILIDDESGRALLADFGIARLRGGDPAMTQAGGVVGTPAYMSPEQAAGRGELDGRSDLYSLGVVLYALLAGRAPFEGKDAGDLLAKHLTQEAVPLKRVRPEISEELAAAVMRCLAKDREARWPDARRLREAIAPTGLDEEQLPEPLDGLDGLVPKLLPVILVWLLSAWHLWVASQAGQQLNSVSVLLAVALGSVLLYQIPWLSTTVALARRRGFSWATIAGATLRQPGWWPLFWYPRRFRRPWDVWDRLPRPFRVFRGALTLGMVVLALVMAMAMRLASQIERAQAAQQDLPPLPAALPMLVAALVLCALMALLALALGARHVLALGYDVYTRRIVAGALLSGPTGRRATWKKFEVARALLAERVRRADPAGEPRSPRDYASAIGRAGGPAGDAEALVVEIEGLDAEIERLAADADPEEAASARRRLEALGLKADAENDERAERRRLLEQQLELAARVDARLEVARERRQGRMLELVALWRAALAARGEPDTATRTAAR
jgi:predicted Ser/Thr protein kinase